MKISLLSILALAFVAVACTKPHGGAGLNPALTPETPTNTAPSTAAGAPGKPGSSVFSNGTGDTGGGNSVVCRDSVGSITSAQMLDLYEGQVRGLHYQGSPKASESDFLDQAVNNFKSDVFNPKLGSYQSMPYWFFDDGTAWNEISIVHYLDKFDQYFVILPENTVLPPLDDSNGIFLPKSCAIERLALYKDSEDKIYLNREIWSHFDARNRAALIFHEASYHYMRQHDGAKDSVAARKLVSDMFADEPIHGILQDVESRPTWCRIVAPIDLDHSGTTPFTEAFFSQDSQGNIYFNFTDILGNVVYEQATEKFVPRTAVASPPADYGNGESISSWGSLPVMRLIEYPYKTIFDTSGNPREIVGIDSKQVVLWIFDMNDPKNTSYHLLLTDDNGDMTCEKPYPAPSIKVHLQRTQE